MKAKAERFVKPFVRMGTAAMSGEVPLTRLFSLFTNYTKNLTAVRVRVGHHAPHIQSDSILAVKLNEGPGDRAFRVNPGDYCIVREGALTLADDDMDSDEIFTEPDRFLLRRVAGMADSEAGGDDHDGGGGGGDGDDDEPSPLTLLRLDSAPGEPEGLQATLGSVLGRAILRHQPGTPYEQAKLVNNGQLTREADEAALEVARTYLAVHSQATTIKEIF